MCGIVLCLEAVVLIAVEMFSNSFQVTLADITRILEIGTVDLASLGVALCFQGFDFVSKKCCLMLYFRVSMFFHTFELT